MGADTDFPYGANDRGNAATEMSEIDEFLDHSTGGFDDEGGVLNWKKNKDENSGELHCWLHTLAPISAVWRHGWYKVKEIEDRDSGKKRVEVFSDRWVCHEKEALLRARKWRFAENDRRERSFPPPCDCAFCKVVEMICVEVKEGRLSWLEPVFEFKGSAGEDRKTFDVMLRAGGLWNAYSAKKLPQNKVAELRRANIRRDDAWREDVRAKCAYLLSVVESAHVENGVRLMIEGEAFKRAFTKAVADERKRMRSATDSPIGSHARPYPFLFDYDKTLPFNERYSATAMSDSPTPAVLELIRDASKIPDRKEFITPGDPEELLASIEEHALIKLPWGDCFGDGKARSQVPAGAPAPAGKAASTATASPAAERLFSCDHCGKATMKGSDFSCSNCGATYVEVGEENAKTVVIGGRPCLKCKELIELPPESPSEPGQKGENVICGKCGAIHQEVGIERADRPCENTACDGRVPLKAGSACGKCGRAHEFGEKDPQDALAVVNAWVLVEEPKAAAPTRGRPGAARRPAAA